MRTLLMFMGLLSIAVITVSVYLYVQRKKENNLLINNGLTTNQDSNFTVTASRPGAIKRSAIMASQGRG